MRRLLREPLLHFLILGALLFVLHGWLNRGTRAAPQEIVLSSARLQGLQTQFGLAWQRAPTQQELQGLVEAWIREEVLFREGLAMGLDRDDPLVRRRIAQKMEFVATGQDPSAPTDAELQAWLDAHPQRYRLEPHYSLRQVFFDPLRHGARLEADMARASAALARGAAVVGDSTMLPAALDDASAAELVRTFGTEFAAALDGLPVGGWQGPVRSSFGLHLVELSQREAGRMPSLAQARAAVERDLLAERSADASASFYRQLRARYTVRVEGANEDLDVAAGDGSRQR